MLSSLISAIVTVLGWVITVLYNIALGFQTIANYANSIPLVGSYLKAAFTNAQAFFNALAYDIAQFSTRVQNVLWAISNALDDAYDLANDVYGWITGKLNDAYNWARSAIQQIPGIIDDIDAIFDELHTPLEIFWYICNYLGVNRKSGESWWQAITRKIAETLSWIDIPTFDEIMTWVMNHLGIYKQSGESWWDAFIRTIGDALGSVDIANLGDKVLEVFGIYRQSGESVWDAIMRTIVSWIPGLAGVVNFWNFFFEDLNLFFGDPPAYFEKKLLVMGSTFAERFWAFVEKILERIW